MLILFLTEKHSLSSRQIIGVYWIFLGKKNKWLAAKMLFSFLLVSEDDSELLINCCLRDGKVLRISCLKSDICSITFGIGNIPMVSYKAIKFMCLKNRYFTVNF